MRCREFRVSAALSCGKRFFFSSLNPSSSRLKMQRQSVETLDLVGAGKRAGSESSALDRLGLVGQTM